MEKYSQFINFPIYIWESKVHKREEEVWRWAIDMCGRLVDVGEWVCLGRGWVDNGLVS